VAGGHSTIADKVLGLMLFLTERAMQIKRGEKPNFLVEFVVFNGRFCGMY
jgi:hypothetical protein